MAQVSRYNTEELKNLVNNDERLEELVNNLPQVKALLTEKQLLLGHNKSIAERNLAKEPELNEARERLKASYEKAVSLRNEFNAKKSELEGICDQRSLGTTLALLQTAAAQSEEESDKIADKFLSGTMDIEEFIDKYKETKQLAHTRKIKADKLMEIVRSLGDRTM
ncbi:unnamed protein product [Soboliphyme baturini]|uniref:VPS37 C-terminal domain-containing protein n=1 Tax=Soboliphyme baturini TaxID=241478 RepID=A0A183IYE7_9BILA|nr:unnamed protein product [Soboliphyme baturini]